MIPVWAYVVASVIYGLLYLRRQRLRRQAQIVNVTEGRHRPIRGGGF